MANYLIPIVPYDDEPTRLSKMLLSVFSVNDNIKCVLQSPKVLSDTAAYLRVILSKMPFRLLLLCPTLIFMIGRTQRNMGSGTVLPMLGKHAHWLLVSSGVQKMCTIIVVPKLVQRSK
jgi:hypothetical protein